MKNLQEIIDRCNQVLDKWNGRSATFETVGDFAEVFELDVALNLVPKHLEGAPTPNVKRPPVEEQGDFFSDFTEQDRSMLGNWRTNNGI
jgi:hypothetical protein